MTGLFGETFGGTVLGGTLPPPSPAEPPVEESGTSEVGVSLMAAEVYGQLEPIAEGDEGRGFPLRAICRALGSMFLQAEEVVRAKLGKDAWRRPFDIDTCPGFLLPFLGQALGLRVDPGLSEEGQREQIRRGHRQATVEAIKVAVEATLADEKRCRVIVRSGTAWQMTVVTQPGETPNAAATEAAGYLAAPYGVVLTFVQSSLPLIDDGTKLIDEVSATIDSATLAQIT